MASNVLLSWTAPSSTTNVSGIKLFKRSGTSAPACGDFIATTALPNDDLPAGTSLCYETTTNLDQNGSYVDQGVDIGNYYYAAYSYNDAGFSPCSISGQVDITV